MADYRTTHKRLFMEHTLLREVHHPRTWDQLLNDVNALLEEQGLKGIGMSTLKADLRNFEECYPERTDLFLKVRRGGSHGNRLLAYNKADEPFPFGKEPEQHFAESVKKAHEEHPESLLYDWLYLLVEGIENGTVNENVKPNIYIPNEQ